MQTFMDFLKTYTCTCIQSIAESQTKISQYLKYPGTNLFIVIEVLRS